MNGSSSRRRTQRVLLAWFAAQARAFPWRETRDGYRTLVAEVMLQQTQTSRVAPAYEAFLRRFPTVGALASAATADVIRAWRGLGYNRRAVALQRAARAVVGEHGGTLPRDVAALDALPGVGPYTASAVACFAFDAQVPVVDTNVRRVLARLSLGCEAREAGAGVLDAEASAWLPAGEAYAWNQALMDLGATVCRSRSPRCDACPVAKACAWRPERRPAPSPAAAERFEGSRRQVRGAVVDALRGASPMTLAALEAAVPQSPTLPEVLAALEADGLVRLTPAARTGSPRGRVSLP